MTTNGPAVRTQYEKIIWSMGRMIVDRGLPRGEKRNISRIANMLYPAYEREPL
jgi:hypothetical protein